MTGKIQLIVNGEKKNVEIEDDELLVDTLREKLFLTGIKYGCGTGECGACTVIIDNVPLRSCLILAAEATGKNITTIEGISKKELDNIQETFIEEDAVQCGFCTPGMIIALEALKLRKNLPDNEDIKEALSGHICRCTGYETILKASKKAFSKEGD